jgi:hypothetical protein
MSTRVAHVLTLGEARAALTAGLRSRLAEIEDAVMTHEGDDARNECSVSNLEFVYETRQLVRECLECSLMAVEHGGEWAGPIPPIVVAHARRAVQNGVPLSSHLERYLAAYKVAWDFVLEEVGVSDVIERDRMALLREASTAYGSLLTRLIAAVSETHWDELQRGATTRTERRAQLVRRLLAGDSVGASELDELDYEFDAEHLGIIASGAGAREAMEVLAEKLGCRLLAVENRDGTVWTWLGAQTRFASAERDIERLLPNGRYSAVAVAVGQPHERIGGFRLTHRLAQAARLVARHRPQPQRVTRYTDVALEAHVLQDSMLTSSLVTTYIEPLEDDRHGAALLDTLRAFYGARRNIATAAVRMGVGRHTVERRLRRIETVLGCQLDACHAQVEIALKVAELNDSRANGGGAGVPPIAPPPGSAVADAGARPRP